MNWLDWIFAVITIAFVIGGVRDGLTRQVVGLAAALIGLFFAAWFYGIPSAILKPYVSQPAIANAIGFVLIFILILLCGALISWVLTRIWKLTSLSWVDRVLGGLFGAIKAALVCVILVMALMAFPIKPVPDAIATSRAAPYLVEASHVLVYLTPKEVKEGFVATYDKVKKLWADALHASR